MTKAYSHLLLKVALLAAQNNDLELPSTSQFLQCNPQPSRPGVKKHPSRRSFSAMAMSDGPDYPITPLLIAFPSSTID
jgi:hypothetical protein